MNVIDSRADRRRAHRADTGSGDVTLLEYWHALYSRRWLVIGITVAVVLLVLVATWLMTPVYRATTTLQIERDAINVVNVENLMPAESPLDRDFYQTQYELLRSRALAQQVIRETRLAEQPAYRDLAEAAVGHVDADAEGSPATLQARRQEAVERALSNKVLEALEVEPVRNSRLAKIHFSAPDAALAAKVANAYARIFIANNLQRRLDASTSAIKYLSGRLQQLRGRVETSERALVDYSGQEQIVSVGDDKPSLPAQNLAELNGMLAAAQNARIHAEASWREASVGDGLQLPQVVANPLVQNLRQGLAALEAEYSQKLATFMPDYPEMKRLQGRIDEGRRQIIREVAIIRASVKAEYDAAARQEQLIGDRIGALKHDELDLQERSIRYNMLRREVDTNRQLYDGLLQRFKEIGVAGNVSANNISVVDAAIVPGSPYSPRLSLNLALGLIFGVFLGLAAALFLHFLESAKAAHAQDASARRRAGEA